MRAHLVALASLALLSCDGCRDASSAKNAIASCVQKTGDVRAHPADEVVWNKLAVGDSLGDGAWVRTAEDSTAEIEFLAGSGISVHASSTVIIRSAPRDEEDVIGLVSLKGGTFRGGLGGKKNALIVEANGRKVRVQPKSGRLHYRVKQEKGAPIEVEVTEGAAEVTAANKVVTVAAGAKVGVTEDGPAELEPPPPPAPPPVVELLERPANEAKISHRSQQPLVTFGWKPADSGGPYEVIVSKSPSLKGAILSEQTEGVELSTRALRDGTYYWGVYLKDQKPGFTKPWRFSLKRRKGRLKGPSKLKW